MNKTNKNKKDQQKLFFKNNSKQIWDTICFYLKFPSKGLIEDGIEVLFYSSCLFYLDLFPSFNYADFDIDSKT